MDVYVYVYITVSHGRGAHGTAPSRDRPPLAETAGPFCTREATLEAWLAPE